MRACRSEESAGPQWVSGVAKILVIEDEAGLRKLLQRMLHEVGHEVLLARESVKGLSLWQSHEVDLVIADIGLPGRSGLETIIHMRTLEPNLPVIVISGRGEEELLDLMTRASRLSSVGIVVKPFGAEELLAAVQQRLGNPPS